MRTTLEIMLAVQEHQPVEERELRLALHALANMQHFYRRSLQRVCEGIETDKPPALLKLQAKNARDIMERMFAARKTDPEKWLGKDNPENPEYQKFLAAGKKMIDRFLEEKKQ